MVEKLPHRVGGQKSGNGRGTEFDSLSGGGDAPAEFIVVGEIVQKHFKAADRFECVPACGERFIACTAGPREVVRVTRADDGGPPPSHMGLVTGGRVRDVWSGIELVVDEVDLASRDALSSPSGPFDGTVVATTDPLRLALLPGSIFHPEDAEPAIADVVALARKRRMRAGAVLDALLRMELSLRVLSRVKPSYAYRAEALGT